MHFFSLEHSKLAYWADFLAYGSASMLLAGVLLFGSPRGSGWHCVALVAIGISSWTLIEYLLHRFVLHAVYPFKAWHAEHHQRPVALICTPTLVSAALIFGLVFLPGLLLGGRWPALAFTLGVLIGYLAYAVTHHAMHHWRGGHPWLKQRKRWHALHHGSGQSPGHFGVTSAVWDRVFSTGGARV